MRGSDDFHHSYAGAEPQAGLPDTMRRCGGCAQRNLRIVIPPRMRAGAPSSDRSDADRSMPREAGCLYAFTVAADVSLTTMLPPDAMQPW